MQPFRDLHAPSECASAPAASPIASEKLGTVAVVMRRVGDMGEHTSKQLRVRSFVRLLVHLFLHAQRQSKSTRLTTAIAFLF